jgi:hypothetical protein
MDSPFGSPPAPQPQAPGGEPKLTGQVLFYNRPEPLSLEKHRNLGVKRIDRPFGFLMNAHIVPITVNEFGVAAGSFPIIFTADHKTPLAVMGARPGDNVFVNFAGDVDPEVYLPAFVRRYPFVFAAAENSDQMLVCIDREAPMIGENPEVRLFDGDQPSAFTNEAIEFCKEFERFRRATEDFCNIVSKYDIFEQKTVAITQRDENGQETNQKVADYHAISEEKLAALTPAQFQELREQGALGPIYAHLVSLLHWPKIVQRTITKAAAIEQGTAGQGGSAPAGGTPPVGGMTPPMGGAAPQTPPMGSAAPSASSFGGPFASPQG